MQNNHKALQATCDRIAQAAHHAGRSVEEITVIAVSKQKSIEEILAIYQAGIRHFGENRREELQKKAVALQHLTDLKWHFIGHLQTRQSQAVVQYAHYFHAVDRLKIAERLSTQLLQLNQEMPVFIQVNISGEDSKGGFLVDNWQKDSQQFQSLIQSIETIATLPRLKILGLMTMAPFDASSETLRYLFNNMKMLSMALQEQFPLLSMKELSMGMSRDFEIAIEAGATYVRIGSAIFGERVK